MKKSFMLMQPDFHTHIIWEKIIFFKLEIC